ncbi:hypothetical protein DENSPDRAFT_530533 [Dentipellis sp. KUC8613]|nr:hypothetical protein DENSPDRAFT_530533 [Dentipellis sp. KUC8613]
MEQPSAAEQRAFAVAKLKRAASLPRMKDGRRPPMHVEGVSEGEKSQGEREEMEVEVEVEGQAEDDEGGLNSDPREEEAQVEGRAERGRDIKANDAKTTEVPATSPPATPLPAEDATAPKAKRRSRSRSRGRGSKDFKGKARATQSPLPTASANDSSPDEGPNPLSPLLNGFASPPPLISPIPSHFAAIQAQRMLSSPEPGLMYPGTSPPTPMLPSLQDIQREALQRGLFRSNSAAARLMALHQLTQGNESFDSSFTTSPPTSPPPLPGKIFRNNTVTGSGGGGDRSAARKLMMRRLGERLKEAETDQTSGGEEQPPPPPPKQRKRRSRRSSGNRPTVVDDRELSSATSVTTPLAPPTALPLMLDPMPESLRPPSARSNTPGARRSSIERDREDALAKLTGSPTAATSYEYESPMGRRGVVVEEDDMPDQEHMSPPRPPFAGLPTPSTPPRVAALRAPHASDAPSNASTESGIGVPVYLSETIHGHRDMFPTSPFATPLREKSGPDDDEDDVYHGGVQAARQSPWTDAYDREISWVADPGHAEPDDRMPVHDDDEYDDAEDTDDQDQQRMRRSIHVEQQSDDQVGAEEDDEGPSPRASADSKEFIVEHDQDQYQEPETSPEPTQSMSFAPPSPSSATALQALMSDDSSSSRVYPARLSVAVPSQPELTPTSNPEYMDWEESLHVISTDTTPKKNGTPNGGDSSVSKWDKVKNTFMRAGSSTGRRSRTNSIRERAGNTDSSVSRESGASLTGSSSKTDNNNNNNNNKGDISMCSALPPRRAEQTPTVDTDLPAPIFPSSPGASSPIPPTTTETMLKYTNSKLFPFPGIIKLEEERNRARGFPLNVSSPDIIFSPTGDELSALSSHSSQTPQPSPETQRDRKLSHQASDTRLLAKFSGLNSPQPISTSVSSASHAEYFNLSTSGSNGSGWLNGKLPTNREGVKKWLSAKKLFSSQSSQPSYPSLQSPPHSAGIVDSRAKLSHKPSVTDLLKVRKESEVVTDWEDLSKTPTSTSGSTLLGKASLKDGRPSFPHEPSVREPPPTEKAPPEPVQPPPVETSSPNGDAQFATYPVQPPDTHSLPSPPDLASSTTPDPMSSLDEYPIRSSTSTLSSRPSPEPVVRPSQGSVVLERLDDMLSRGTRGNTGTFFFEDPPRKLLLSSPVLQVANANTVKDRFLFLFTDILVIAKPIAQDLDALLDTTKRSPLDRKFVVKSVVQLRQLRFTADRDDLQPRALHLSALSRHPIVRTFVVQFTKDADQAIAAFFEKTGMRDDPVVLGQILFKAIELDRARLGDYLSRRTSKFVLKAYIDGFGFCGIRVDKALRVFLQSLHIPSPSRSSHSSPVDYMIDAFASRWYEANAKIVAYDKDLAVRLARAIVQLNEVLFGGITAEAGPVPQVRRTITARDFINAFRRYDPRCLVSDDLLDKIYTSIRREPLSQARNPAHASTPDLNITMKRLVPLRLTYRMQSEPVILRLPQADPNLVIHIHGQDLIIDPPFLTFARSAEASFRITGTSLGRKTLSFSRAGSSAPLYAGLPLSSAIVVERGFMRNTFQVAFANHAGEKRRYMFSVDDPVIRHNWTVSLRRQIDAASAPPPHGLGAFFRAAEDTAFRVLQDTLVVRDDAEWDKGARSVPPTPLPGSHSHSQSQSPSPNGSAFRVPALKERRSRLDGSSPAHARSKSRSQVYHRQGPGKLEQQELAPAPAPDAEAREDERVEAAALHLWTGKDLERVCQQNSAIPPVLASMQIGARANGNGGGVGGSSPRLPSRPHTAQSQTVLS